MSACPNLEGGGRKKKAKVLTWNQQDSAEYFTFKSKHFLSVPFGGQGGTVITLTAAKLRTFNIT